MAGKNQAQKRRDRAKTQREQERGQQLRSQGQDAQLQSSKARQNQGQGQDQAAQPQPFRIQGQQNRAQEQVPHLSISDISDRIRTLTPALQDLQRYDLISEQEAQEIRKVKVSARVIQELDRSCQEGGLQGPSQEETAQQEFLTAVSEKLQAFLNDDQKPSKHRREVRRAKEVIRYHQDFRSRYRATYQLRRDQTQGVQQQQDQAPLIRQQQDSDWDAQRRASQGQAAEQQPHLAPPSGALATLTQPFQPRQQQGQASQRLGTPQIAQQQRQPRPEQRECMEYLLICGDQFKRLLDEMRLLGLLSDEDIRRLPPPDTGTEWLKMIEMLESRIEARHRAGSRSARRHPQTGKALCLIAGLKSLLAGMSNEEVQQRRGQQLRAAVQEVRLRQEVEGLRLRPGRGEQAPQNHPAEAMGQLVGLLKDFHNFGLITRHELRETRIPESASACGRLMDLLHEKVEAYRLGGGEGGRSAEELERLSVLQGKLVVCRLRYQA